MIDSATSFNLSATPGQDIWKKPPKWNLFNAVSRCLEAKPLSTFKSATISFPAQWEFEYDQAGLVLELESKTGGTQDRKWVKAGFECFQGQPQVSVVACDRFADWSIVPLANLCTTKTVKVLVQREEDVLGVSLWVYFVKEDGQKLPLREICWFFDEDGTGKEWNLTVSAYASRPDYRQTSKPLDVEITGLEAEWSDE